MRYKKFRHCLKIGKWPCNVTTMVCNFVKNNPDGYNLLDNLITFLYNKKYETCVKLLEMSHMQ